MILKGTQPYIEVEPFLSGLQRAMGSVGRLGSPSVANTAWLITDSLVLTLAMNVRGDLSPKDVPHIRYFPSSEPDMLLEVEHLYDPPLSKDILTGAFNEKRYDSVRDLMVPLVLRLRQPLAGRALSLAIRSPEPDEQLFILHHPEGKPRLHLSIGELQRVDSPRFLYNASTAKGSSGAPLLNSQMEVIGVHLAWRVLGADRYNEGLSLAGILAALRSSPVWSEIASYHRLADLSPTTMTSPPAESEALEAATEAPSRPGLLAAAVRWSFDPAAFDEAVRKELQPLVGNLKAERWSLRADDRRRLLLSASLDELRAARGDAKAEDTGQRVIDTILAGPPFDLDAFEEDELSHWLQAVRWFAGVVPSLPTPGEVHQALELRRVRGRLQRIAGPDFAGRGDELTKLRAWFDSDQPGPMTITGIGGVGKSALVSYFALGLPDDVAILWLDFDRADIAPDDAVSVLTLLSAQAAVQLPGFSAPTFDQNSWEEGARALGAALAAAGADKELLVLDGFEIAQYVERHQEIWRVLELILEQAAKLRVLVSGRVLVPNLVLAGRPAEATPLVGLARPDAEKWLRGAGIDDAAVIERILDASQGVPLVLILFARWLRAGGNVAELDEKSPEVLVEGFLYQRILDRVVDQSLKPVARDALVLRRVTVELIDAALSDSIPEGLSAAEVYDRLEREVALAGYDVPGLPATGAAGEVLHLRPEVRAATLRLLESADADRVRAIDERAAAWYADQDQTDAMNVAELVYHRLRLGDVAGAAAVWQDDCVRFLQFAEDDMPVEADEAREWLRERLEAGAGTHDLEIWEQDAVARIKDALGRRLLRAVPSILAEHPERSPFSPLVLYDAWELRQAGDPAGALQLLRVAGEVDGPVGRDRLVLAALLTAETGRPTDNDRLLVRLGDEALWRDSKDGAAAALAATAARLRAAVDLDAEAGLIEALRRSPNMARRIAEYLSPVDVILPQLAGLLSSRDDSGLEGLADAPEWRTLEIPSDPVQEYDFRYKLDEARVAPLPEPFIRFARVVDDEGEAHLRAYFEAAGNVEPAVELAALGWRRWRVLSAELFLARACDRLRDFMEAESFDPLSLSLLGALSIFPLLAGRLGLRRRDLPIEAILLDTVMSKSRYPLMPTRERVAYALELSRRLNDADSGGFDHSAAFLEKALYQSAPVEGEVDRVSVPLYALIGPNRPFAEYGERTYQFNSSPFAQTSPGDHSVNGLFMYLLCPSPLEALAEQVIGLPVAGHWTTSGK